MNFKDNLKKLRKDNNLSQEELAEKLYVTRQAVSKWESGAAYPEMDKVLQICKLFNVNINDLLNNDIKNINKDNKNNFNKYFDDFLNFITQTINVLSSMKFGSKIKCIIEQIFIASIFFSAFMIIGSIGSYMVSNILYSLPRFIYDFIYGLIECIYIIVFIMLWIVIHTHIFKVRYLDYYEVIDDQTDIDDKKDNITYLKKEKIIIRDPKHSGQSFISGIVKCIIFIIKFMSIFIIIGLAFSLISLTILSILSLLFIKTGLTFIGAILILLSSIVVNIIFLYIFYNFIINYKSNWRKIGISFLVSLFVCGIGIGLFIISIKDYNILTEVDNIHYYSKSITTDIKKINTNCYHTITIVEEDRDDMKIEVKYYKHNNIDIIDGDSLNIIVDDIDDTNMFIMMREFINDINHKNIIEYYKMDIIIYASMDNIKKLNINRDNM